MPENKSVTQSAGDPDPGISIADFLDLITPDLEISARDASESLRAYSGRVLAAVRETRFALLAELDELEEDLEHIIDHLSHTPIDGESHD